MKSASYVRAAILAALALVLGVALKAIHDREQTLAHGQVVLVQLAPVDPRSLMQGDYMALRFAIDNELPARDGHDRRRRRAMRCWRSTRRIAPD
ncbi:GDYXXLXY domain-containing protein [Thauera humireducens]|uniref:GDYXXLXY domain-containing protein n=1 Tax=Thauera humireducens TaxID=1134435 RepID=UPI00311D7FC7